MERATLLADFHAAMELYERHRGFVTKARAKAGEFLPEVVDRVVADHEARGAAVLARLGPSARALEAAVATVADARDEASTGRQPLDDRRQELELRHLISEISDADFEAQIGEVSAGLAAIDETVGGYDEELGRLRGALERWGAVGRAEGDTLDQRDVQLVSLPPADDRRFDVLEELDLLPDG